jgi:Saxitoxin biosynthesis operon protein SxtJ
LSSIEASLTLGPHGSGRTRRRSEDLRQFRSFGLLVGAGWAILGLWPAVVRGGTPRAWALALGLGLLVAALIMPAALRPIHRVWMALGNVLGQINTKIVLTLIFFVVITPIGVVLRLFRADPLQRRFDPQADTYRVVRKPRESAHLRRQF